MSLRDPTSKMSKSDVNADARINITDSVDAVRAKLRRAVTDSVGRIYYDPLERPGVRNACSTACLCLLSHADAV